MIISTANIITLEVYPFSFTKEVLIPKHYNLHNNKISFVIDGNITEQFDVYILEAKLTSTFDVNCDLCLRKIDSRQLVIDIKEFYSDEIDDTNETDEVWKFSNKVINIEDAVMTNLLLNIPTKFLCNDDCKGLCHQCGANLNEVTCNCESNKKLSKFGELYNLLKDNEEV